MISQYVMYFDYAAVCICILLLYVNSQYTSIRTRQDRVFGVMLICALLSSLGDPLTVFTTNTFPKLIGINYFINIVYAVIQNMMGPLFYVFNLVTIKKWDEDNISGHYMLLIPYLVDVALIISTPITHLVLYIHPDGTYTRGAGMFVLFVAAIFYYALGIRLVIIYRKKVKKLQRVCAEFYASIMMFSFMIQYSEARIMIAQFATALSMIFIFLTLKNPMEFMDSSTRVFNREGFIEVMEEKISKNGKFAVVGVQIEGIKYVSERYGAENGSSLLNSTAEFLKMIDRRCMVFHISAVTKFAILVPEEVNADMIVDKVRRRFNEAFYINEAEVSIWAHISEFNYPEDVKSVQDALDTIDYVTIQASETKEQQIIYGSEFILQKKRREREIEQALDICIAHESFEVFFQPIINVVNNKYESAEALVRLKSPGLGMIMPSEFIPLAEKSGQIIQVGDIVLKKVCRFIHEQKIMEKSDIRCINVNLSGMQCMQPDVGQHLLRLIDQAGVPHSMINFEITESYASSDWDKLFRNMMELSVRGVSFALDDYGTGYSNMANIMKYRYSVVKLDKSMLDAADTGRQAYVLLMHTIRMIKDLNMNVLIEGVETEKQLDMVKRLGVDYIQGFYFSKPLPGEEFIKFITQ